MTDQKKQGSKFPFTGHFLDDKTMAFALTDKGYSLEKACKDFGVEHGKEKAEQHGVVTDAYIDYNRRDVKATGELLMKLLEEFERHPIPLQATKAFSAASIGKGYERAMGIRPVLSRQSEFPRDVLAHAMNAFYGGRAECRIRRTALPVVYVDFLSMYPTVNALMGNWSLLTAAEIEVVDATEEVRSFLTQVTLDDCFSPELWQKLRAFVRVRPQGEVYPVRARFDPRGQTWQNSCNPLTCEQPMWFALPDVVQAKLLSHRTPEVLEAFRLIPHGKQSGLRPVKLRGQVLIDPRTQDFFKVVIEERKRVQARTDLEEAERTRLDKALKVIANAGSYGIFAEMNRKEESEDVPVNVWDCAGEVFTTKTRAPESPGPHCFPPLAALITSAARLMLAILERSVTASGGSYVFCDTDSLAIVASEGGGLLPCPGGPHRLPDGRDAVRALSWPEVEELRQHFAALNPYDREAVPGSVLKAEGENFDPETGEQREVFCFAISAKRYVLYVLNAEGRPAFVKKPSRHGLGYLLNPINPESKDKNWIEDVWRYILEVDAFGREPKEPEWFSRPAVSRATVSDPDTLALFNAWNQDKSYADQIKPYNFLLSAQAAELPPELDPKEPFHLFAPYHTDPAQWRKLKWVDRYSKKHFHITTRAALSEGVVRVKTCREIVSEYRLRPEHKSLAPDGSPCAQATKGLLRRRPVEAIHVVYVGKESNRLDDVQRGLIADKDEVANEYEDAKNDTFVRLVRPVLRSMPLAQLTSESGLNRSTVKRIRSGKQRPHPGNEETLTSIAAVYARTALGNAGAGLDDLAVLYCYLGRPTD